MSVADRDQGSAAAQLGSAGVVAEATSTRTPKVSVVLTTYKRAHLIRETIDSILRQTQQDFELVISDDCSPDETEAVCRAYERSDARVRYRRGEKNIGMPGNLNAGILATCGEYVANLHDGDVYEPTLLERWAAALDAYPQAAFVFNAYRALDSAGHTVRVWEEPLGPCAPGRQLLEEIYFRRWRFNSPVWGTVMARRSAYLRAGLFDQRFGFISDVDMWMRLAEESDVAYISEPLIGLPSRETVPRLWGGGERPVQKQAERMFREARIRHYRNKPVRLILELTRHAAFVAAVRAFRGASRAKAALRRMGKTHVDSR